MPLAAKDWITHQTLGSGQILSVDEGYYFIHFLTGEQKKVVKSFVGVGAPPSPDFVFPSLSAKSLNTKSKNLKKLYAFEHLVERFLARYPSGFSDSQYLADERAYKDAAVERLSVDLSADELHRLISEGKFSEIATRAKHVMNRDGMNLIFRIERAKWSDGLKTEEGAKRFAMALDEVLYGTANPELAFEQYATALGELKCATWTLCTFFQFLATAGKSMFMKPAISQLVAASAGVALNYKSTPNWLTFSKLQEAAAAIEKKLKAAGLEPKDGIDVQSFMFVAWFEVQPSTKA